MLDLGTSFLASVARDPDALALVDGDVRFTYAEWLGKISSLVAAFDRMGLKRGDHLLTALQKQLAGRIRALGLPAGGPSHHPDQLASEGRRTRFLHREL